MRGGVGSKLVLKEPQLAAVFGPVIHAYWLQKRQKLGNLCLRRFWPATSPLIRIRTASSDRERRKDIN